MSTKTIDQLQAENESLRQQVAALESEQPYRLILDTAPAMIWQSGPDLQCQYVNRAWLELTGTTFEQAMGSGWSESVHPEDKERIQAIYFPAFESHREFEMEYRVQRHDGVYRWILTRAAPVLSKEGEFFGYVGSCVDISDRKQAEQELCRARDHLAESVQEQTAALVEAEEKWRSLVTTAPDFILIFDRDGTIRYINRTVEGRTREEVIGASGYDFIAPEFHAKLSECIQRVFDTGCQDSYEPLSNGPDNSKAWYSVRLGPFREGDRITGVTAIATDITEKKRIEQALRKETEYSRHIVTCAPVIICGVRPDGTTNSVNAAITAVAGYEPEEVIGKNWWNLFYPGKDGEQVEKLFQDFKVLGGEVTNYDMVITTKEGGKRTISWNSVNRFDEDGKLLEIIGIGADITDRKRAQQALLSEQRLLRNLLNILEKERQFVSHEIHDGVLQYAVAAKMLLESLAHQMTASGMQVPDGCSQVKELLAKAIVEGRRLIGELRPMIIDEQGIVEAINYLVAEETGMNGIEVDFTHDVKFDRLAPMLESALFRIVQEALNNVKRHSQSEKAEITLKQFGKELMLEVHDFGVGFDVGQVPSDHFGLRGISERARLFGGSASIESVVGKGTRIVVRVPVTVRDEMKYLGEGI